MLFLFCYCFFLGSFKPKLFCQYKYFCWRLYSYVNNRVAVICVKNYEQNKPQHLLIGPHAQIGLNFLEFGIPKFLCKLIKIDSMTCSHFWKILTTFSLCTNCWSLLNTNRGIDPIDDIPRLSRDIPLFEGPQFKDKSRFSIE